jgi:ribosomal protein S15
MQQRAESLGDPVRGITTPFVESFDTATPLKPSEKVPTPAEEDRLNYGLRPEDLEQSLERSKYLAVPQVDDSSFVDLGVNSEEKRDEAHKTASAAIERITALANGSSKNRMKVNVARCVNTFGRHNTDLIFPPKAPALADVSDPGSAPIRPATNEVAAKKRAGPDTGSSEVQIAILTGKIRTLADFLEKRGKGDKHNKRNLRLLVHRRQKLLQYLKRKERGGPRWKHCIETLGLTEGTYVGEISL